MNNIKHGSLVALFFFSFALSSFAATGPAVPAADAPVATQGHDTPAGRGLRLIQWGDGPEQRGWLTPDQVGDRMRASHEAGHCGGFFDLTDYPRKLNRAPLTTLLPHGLVVGAEPSLPHVVEPLISEISADRIHSSVEQLSSLPSRHYRSEDGVAAAHWIRDQFVAMAAGRSDITVELVEHSFLQPSVVARIMGSGENANEMVIVGGHEDSINQWGGWFGGGEAPGADDNASGTATVLEVFRVLAQSGFRPSRTLLFMTYAGEEAGLLGSQDIAERFRRDGMQVAGVMQFDMTMFPGSRRAIHFITDHTNPELTRYAQMLTDRYVGYEWSTSACGYACSDHASWTSAGYPSVFPFEASEEEMNGQIHTSRDTLAILDVGHGAPFARLGLAFAVELSSGI